MTTKKKATKKTTTTTTSRVYRANSKPTRVVHIKTPNDVDKHVAATLSKKTRNFAINEMLTSSRLVQDLTMLLEATTEAIEHYAEGERKNDPVVLAHAVIAKKSRTLLKELDRSKAK
jgi:hypothetical protein